MTLAEKVSQMQNIAVAIPRLGIPAYDWWNEALPGIGPVCTVPSASSPACRAIALTLGEGGPSPCPTSPLSPLRRAVALGLPAVAGLGEGGWSAAA
jgi:hypothetical protein